jgi:predicted transposase YbfD/YdcC
MNREVHVPFCEKLAGKFRRFNHREYHWELDVHLNDDADKKHDKMAVTNFAKTKGLLLCLVKSKIPEGTEHSVRLPR